MRAKKLTILQVVFLTAVLLSASIMITSCSDFFDVVPVSAPTTIVVTQESDTSNYISWTAVAGATGYKVYRSTSVSGTYTECASITGGSVLYYYDSSLESGTTYYYKVAAVNHDGTGYISPVATLSAPTGIMAEASTGSNTVSWDQVAGATGYKVYQSTTVDGTYTECGTVTDGTTTFVHSGLTTGTTYFYKVATVNSGGTGAMSEEIGSPGTIGGYEVDPGTTLASRSGYIVNTGTARIAYAIKTSAIDVIGSTDGGTTWGNSTYSNKGWIFNWNETPASSLDQTISDVNYKVVPLIVNTTVGTEDRSYIIFQYTITNNSSAAVTVKFGSNADTMVGSNDSVPIYRTSYGLRMTSGAYTFALYLRNSAGVSNVSTLWAGGLGSRTASQYVSTTAAVSETVPIVSSDDSAATYSWMNVTIQPGQSAVRRSRLALGTL